MDKPLHQRRSIRFKEYDYSSEGLYFVTICCQDKICRFGKIVEGEMYLNDAGKIARDGWLDITIRFPCVILHEYIIMPNHIHSIIEISPTVGVTLAVTRNNDNVNRVGASPTPTLGDIIGAYKSITANACLKLYNARNETMGRLWQRNYYEHIIRHTRSYENIARYIYDNPANWENDDYFMNE